MNEITQQIVREMKLEKTVNYEHPFFTGWKEEMRGAGTPIECGTGGYVGQLIHAVSEKGKQPMLFAYVNLPGLESGIVQVGACLSIGTERIREPLSVDAMKEMLTKGLEKLKSVVEQYKANGKA